MREAVLLPEALTVVLTLSFLPGDVSCAAIVHSAQVPHFGCRSLEQEAWQARLAVHAVSGSCGLLRMCLSGEDNACEWPSMATWAFEPIQISALQTVVKLDDVW